jgi:hypothetical protein
MEGKDMGSSGSIGMCNSIGRRRKISERIEGIRDFDKGT